MRVLITTLYCTNTPHFETELEIIQSHIDKGDEVVLLRCDFSFPSCDVNILHKREVCYRCIGRRKSGVKNVVSAIEVKPILNLMKKDKDDIRELQYQFSQNMDLKELVFRDFDIGYGIFSSLVSYGRDPKPDLKKEMLSEVAKNMLDAAASTYLSMKNHLANNQYDQVYVYNGRYAIMRAILRACQSSNVDCYCHERGGSVDKYSLYKNSLPHDRGLFQKNMVQAWRSADKNERVLVGSEFFVERRNGVDQSWHSFVKEQEQGKLPTDWDDSKRNMVLFNSSEDEFAAIGREWETKIYSSQSESIKRLITGFIDDPGWHFFLRVHPNLKSLNNSQTQEINSLDYPNLTVIPAESPISSYALMDEAEKVIVFGSTMGIEATYWGKTAILLGRAFYESIDVVYEPKTHKEAVEMIRSDLEPKEKERTLPYGYYNKTFGIKFKYYKASGIYTGKFKGQFIEVDHLTQRIAYYDSWIRRKLKHFYSRARNLTVL